MSFSKALLAKVKTLIEKYHLLASDQKIIISFSGGPDSVFLALALKDLYPQKSISLLYFDHGLRDTQDERVFVKSFAQQVNSSYEIVDIPVEDVAKQEKISIEMAGRYCRQRYFFKLGESQDSFTVMTGHHQDDDLETLVLKSMQTQEGLFYGLLPKLRVGYVLAHPLLDLSKEEILRALHKREQLYMDDPTNLSLSFQRNRIRHEVLPRVSKAKRDTFRLQAAVLRDSSWKILNSFPDMDTFIIQSPNKLIISLDIFNLVLPEFSKLLLVKLLHHSLAKLKGALLISHSVNHHQINALHQLLQDKKTGKLSLPFDYECEISNSVLEIRQKVVTPSLQFNYPVTEFDQTLTIPNSPIELSFTVLEKPPETLKSTASEAYIDLDKIGHPLQLRNKRAGDQFQPLGFKVPVKLKSYLIKQKVAKAERDLCPILSETDTIIWIPGLAISEKVKVDSSTKKVLYIKAS